MAARKNVHSYRSAATYRGILSVSWNLHAYR